MGPLARNLDALGRKDPALARRIEAASEDDTVATPRAPSGAFAFRLGSRFETSLDDPEAEGRALAEHLLRSAARAGAKRLVIVGFPAYALSRLAEFEGELLIVEPCLEFVRAVLARVELSAALARVELAVADCAAPIAERPVFSGPDRGVVLATPSALRRAGTLFQELVQRMQPGGPRPALDIALIPPLCGGSLPVALACGRALRALGHHVRELELEPFLPAHRAVEALLPDLRLAGVRSAVRAGLDRLLGQALLAAFRLEPPDLVFALAQAPLDAQALADLRRVGVPVVYWFCEDFRVMTYWRELARHCDAFFHLQPDTFTSPLAEVGGRGFPLPMAFDPAVHRPLEPRSLGADEALPLSFVGAAYHNRLRFLPGLFDLGLRVYGVGWPLAAPWLEHLGEPGVRQSSEASNRIFNRSEINLNLHSSPWTDGVNPAGDYLNPRTFELAGARAFQLVDVRSDLARAFEPEREIATFRDLEECRARIRHFRAAADERRELAARAHARALREHTYEKRMQLALDVLHAGGAPLRPRKRSVPTVAHALREAESEPGLARILARLEPERALDARSISEAVERGQGPLCEEEKLLLFMREAATEIELGPPAGAA